MRKIGRETDYSRVRTYVFKFSNETHWQLFVNITFITYVWIHSVFTYNGCTQILTTTIRHASLISGYSPWRKNWINPPPQQDIRTTIWFHSNKYPELYSGRQQIPYNYLLVSMYACKWVRFMMQTRNTFPFSRDLYYNLYYFIYVLGPNDEDFRNIF